MDKAKFTKALGENIREMRVALGISQAELARRCEKDQQHIDLIERGKTTCTSYTFFLICHGLECLAEDILPVYSRVAPENDPLDPRYEPPTAER